MRPALVQATTTLLRPARPAGGGEVAANEDRAAARCVVVLNLHGASRVVGRRCYKVGATVLSTREAALWARPKLRGSGATGEGGGAVGG
jgi:hypothetical protein